MPRLITQIFFLAFCALSFFSCGPKVIFEKVTSVDYSGWGYEDEVGFEVEISDTSIACDLLMNLTFDPNFGYENLYLLIKTDFPNMTSTRDSVSFQLNGDNGVWNGDCNTEECRVQFYLKQNIHFKEPGPYYFGFQQFSREKSLRGIKALGIKIVEIEPPS